MLLVIDTRLQASSMVRKVVGSALYPLERVAVMPRDLVRNIGDYFSQVSTLQKENAELKRNQLLQSVQVQQDAQLKLDNEQLRKLLATSKQLPIQMIQVVPMK